MLVYAVNDYDTTPGKDISAELDRLHKSHLLKIYPVIGKTSDDGHSLLYLARIHSPRRVKGRDG